ncbi:MAG TPA: hypothetical protein VKB76_19195, partial [Ktedonobacterales bacterium]|nr:hypothetical protein [Ktedonobacterales bacterium]
TPALALCTLVGDDLGSNVIAQSQRSLASEHIQVHTQAASRDALSFIIPEEALDSAIRRLHKDIIEPALHEAAQHQQRPYADGQWAAGGRAQLRRKLAKPQH